MATNLNNLRDVLVEYLGACSDGTDRFIRRAKSMGTRRALQTTLRAAQRRLAKNGQNIDGDENDILDLTTALDGYLFKVGRIKQKKALSAKLVNNLTVEDLEKLVTRAQKSYEKWLTKSKQTDVYGNALCADLDCVICEPNR